MRQVREFITRFDHLRCLGKRCIDVADIRRDGFASLVSGNTVFGSDFSRPPLFGFIIVPFNGDGLAGFHCLPHARRNDRDASWRRDDVYNALHGLGLGCVEDFRVAPNSGG